MIPVGILAAWFGYSVFYYGLDTVTGGNDTFVSLIWPGKYVVTAKDSGAGAAAPPLPKPGQPGGLAAGVGGPGFAKGTLLNP
jgi:hypothetical protein